MNNTVISTRIPTVWIIVIAVAASLVLLALLCFIIMKINRRKQIEASENAAAEKVRSAASHLSSLFGGNENILQISSKGSRVTVTVKDPSAVEKKEIDKTLDSVMYMGNKVVFIIGEKSEEFQKLLSENIDKQKK